MGQIFYMTIYDPKTRKCYSENSDKFHANCYSYSHDINVAHYLLRQRSYHVMWCGDYICINGNLNKFSTEDQLLGISVTKDLSDFEDDECLPGTPYYENVKFIDENHKSWKKIDFDYNHTKSVRYDGYLINHTKKKAIDLKEYYNKSLLFKYDVGNYLVDLIPPLTETGSEEYAGTHMALFDGCSAEVTENLIGQWCGDLLEIIDQPPQDYEIIDCCFAPVWERTRYYEKKFGLDEENFVLKNKNKDRFEAVKLSFVLTRSKPSYIKSYNNKYEAVPKSIVMRLKKTKEILNNENFENQPKKKNKSNSNNNISENEGMNESNKKRKTTE